MDRKSNPRHPRVYVYLFLILAVAAAAAQLSTRTSSSRTRQDGPTIQTDKSEYLPGDTIVFSGTSWAPGEAVTIVISNDVEEPTTLQATADSSGSFSVTSIMPDNEVEGNKFSRLRKRSTNGAETGGPSVYHAVATGSTSAGTAETEFDGMEPLTDAERLIDQETYWLHRITYPTGNYNPEWLQKAVAQDAKIARAVPAGRKTKSGANKDLPLALNSNAFTALGPQPERMTGCSGCFDYTTTAGRINAIAVDPTTTSNGSIVAYAASVGGGVWKTTNCCSASTTWTAMTDDPLISTLSIDTLVIDPNNHNVVYAGTGDLNYGSFSMGSQGILKSMNAGATWTVLGANVFGAGYAEPPGQFPQYDAVGKVRVDPNNSNRVVAGTKKGVFVSYDGGTNWTGPCTTNSFNTQRQDITGLELSNMGGGVTRILAAVGVRGFATTVQFDLGNNGANGIYSATMPGSGCPTFNSIAGNANGFVFGTAVTGSPYTTGANLNAGSGSPFVNTTSGDQLGRIDIAVAPSNPNVIYAQVQSIAPNNNAGCGNTNGCQLGVWASTDGGANWTFMTGSAGGSLRNCAGGNTSSNPGDYPQNWYDQGIAVDPNNPDRLFVDTYDTWFATRTGTAFFNVTCGYNGSSAANHVVHVDHHALAFVPGSSSILLEGSDGGMFSSSNANTATSAVRNTWVNMDGGLNTIEFYNGDISANFATSASPQAAGGAQDNMCAFVTFPSTPTGPVQWQGNIGGDGFFARIDGKGGFFYASNNNGALHRCTANCSNSGAVFGGELRNSTMQGDRQSFVEPFDLFRGNPGGSGNAECAGARCNHVIVGSFRVWENITIDTVGSTGWTARTGDLTKNTLGNRSFINNLHYSPANQTLAIVGTNDGNVQALYGLGGASGVAGTAVNLTGGNAVLPNRPILDVAFDPRSDNTPANPMIGYAAVGGFNANTPSTPGHVFRVVCNTNCASSTWTDKTSNLPDIPVDSIIVNPNFPQQVFAGTDIGLYYTDDITAVTPVWNRFQAGVPNVMIWSMSIDRGNTTLSLWTRSRGAFVWPLTLGPLNPLPTNLTVNSATGNFAGTVNLSATLTSGGNGVAGKTIDFTLNGNSVGSGPTDSNGVATLNNASLAGINGGLYPTGVGASFAGDSVYASASATNSLTVLQKPTITCPASFSADADDGSCAAVVNFTGAHAATAIGYPVPTISYSPASGGSFPVGATTVTATATNSEGSDSCTFVVTVIDTQPPAVSAAIPSPNSLWPPEHQMVPVTVNYTATDNCSVRCVLTVASNEPINGLGDGDTSPDWEVIDAHHLLLRSERSGKGNGRTYTITVTCTDAAGHTVVRTTTVVVPKSEARSSTSLNPSTSSLSTAGSGLTTSSVTAAITGSTPAANRSPVVYLPYPSVSRSLADTDKDKAVHQRRVSNRRKKLIRKTSEH